MFEGIVTLVKPRHRLNTPPPNVLFFKLSPFIIFKALQPAKALTPTLVKDGGNRKFVILPHEENAPKAILVIVDGNIALVSPLQFWNALVPILFTNEVSRFILVKLFPKELNALLPIAVTVSGITAVFDPSPTDNEYVEPVITLFEIVKVIPVDII